MPSGNDGGFFLGKADVWGNDAFVLDRYAEFMAFTRGLDPNYASQAFRRSPPGRCRPSMRCCAASTSSDSRPTAGSRFSLARAAPWRERSWSGYRVLGGRDAIFAAMSRPGFDPRQTVLLESTFAPARAGGQPRHGPGGGESPDELEIDADVPSPALLLVTDPYSRDWRAVSLPAAPSSSYRVCRPIISCGPCRWPRGTIAS